MTVCLSITFIPSELKAVPNPTSTQSSNPAAKAEVLINRLEELKALDKSTLTRTEKKALRKEVKSINSQLKAVGGGVYISAGALILILVLLIIFL